MELTVASRTTGKKSETKKIRREGNIAAVIYSKGEKGEDVVVDGNAFKKLLNKVVAGTLSSKIFTLKLDGKSVKAIIKEIQYAITSYDVIHIDFVQLHDDVPLTLNIPVVFINAVECAGVKLGGALRQVIRYVKVHCLPKDIPQQFELDVGDLLLGQSLKLNKLEIPSGVRPITDLKEVVVVMARK